MFGRPIFGRIISTTASFAIAGLMVTAPVQAQNQPSGQVELRGDVKLVKTVEANGVSSTSFIEPEQVVPGDRLRFVTEYENTTGAVVDDFVVDNPLPEAVMLAENGDFEVSVDGGKSFGALDRMSVLNSEGERAPASAENVTHLRWTFDRLEPGAKGSLEYFAVIR